MSSGGLSWFDYNNVGEPFPKPVASAEPKVFIKFYPPLGPWSDEATCKTSDLNFFPDRGETAHRQKAVCFSCPCRLDCLEYAVQNSITYGIWGGTSARERRAIRARSRLSVDLR